MQEVQLPDDVTASDGSLSMDTGTAFVIETETTDELDELGNLDF